MEVVSMDDARIAILTDIFWQMNEISFRTEEWLKSSCLKPMMETAHRGNHHDVTQIHLYITVSYKTVEEMADQFGVSEEQQQRLAALLKEENNML